MKKIKKDCLKNMVAEPNLLDINIVYQNKQSSCSYSQKKKDSLLTLLNSKNPSVHKNSLGPCFNSDDEDIKNQEKADKKAVNLINREAKTW